MHITNPISFILFLIIIGFLFMVCDEDWCDINPEMGLCTTEIKWCETDPMRQWCIDHPSWPQYVK